MSNKFASTINTYNQYASQFVKHFENRLETTELDKFLLQIPKAGYILDAGCGSGRDCAYMMSQGYKTLGIDLSEGLLTEANKLHPEVTTQLMSLTDISLPNKEFDGVWCKATLLHLERTNVSRVLADFYRILKKGGQLFIQTKLGEGEADQPTVFDNSLTRHFTFFTLKEMVELIEQAGFVVTESYVFNGKQRNMISRDQDWLVVFAKKN